MTQRPASTSSAATAKAPLAAPSIPIMKGQVILLADLNGLPLETWITYEGMKFGDTVVPHWRGRGVDGQPFDEIDQEYFLGDDQPLRVLIDYDRLQAIDGGEAFYSYALKDESGSTPRLEESLRLICYINRPQDAAVALPVAHIAQSHDLHVDLDDVPANGVTVLVAPYQAMAIGDQVTLRWQGYRNGDSSVPINPPYASTKRLTASDVDQPLTFLLPKSHLRNANGSFGDVTYDVQYSNQTEKSVAQSQRFQVKAPAAALLEKPVIEGFSGGELDPGQYPAGIPVRCPLYPQLLPGDSLWLRWQGSREAIIQYRYLDPSIVDSQKLEFVVPAEDARRLGNPTVTWQFSRAGTALSSEALPIILRSSLTLPMPTVEGTSQEAGAPADEGYLRPESIISQAGVYINIPAAADYPGATVAVHWEGHAPEGRTVVQRPVSADQPKRFYIAPQFAAANMGEDETKRFDVFYRATADGGYQDSPAYKLLIRAPLPERLPQLECTQASAGTLSKSRASSGAALVLPGWMLMAARQLLTIKAEGVGMSGQPMPWTFAYTVKATDVSNKRISTTLPGNFVTALGLNTPLSFSVSVSFDDGLTAIDYPPLRLQIVA